MNAMAQDPEGQKKLDELEERVDRAMADYVREHAEAEQDPGPQLPDHIPGRDHEREDLGGEHHHRASGSRSRPIDNGFGVRGGLVPPADEASPAETPAGVEVPVESHPGGDDPMDMDLGGGDVGAQEGQSEVMDTDLLDDELVCLIQQLGVCPVAYAREQRQGLRALVSEIYSPPRVTAMLRSMPSLRLAPGFALDLTVPSEFDGSVWDFSLPEKRAQARALLRQQKPMLLFGSPEGRGWSS